MGDSEVLRAAVSTRAAAILTGDASPYDLALEILGLVSGGLPVEDGDEGLYSLANLWGELTDRVELRPAEADHVEAHMVAAAREWLTAEGDREAEARYLDCWLHDILGYKRPASPQRDERS